MRQPMPNILSSRVSSIYEATGPMQAIIRTHTPRANKTKTEFTDQSKINHCEFGAIGQLIALAASGISVPKIR